MSDELKTILDVHQHQLSALKKQIELRGQAMLLLSDMECQARAEADSLREQVKRLTVQMEFMKALIPRPGTETDANTLPGHRRSPEQSPDPQEPPTT